jgi:TonB family protein
MGSRPPVVVPKPRAPAPEHQASRPSASSPPPAGRASGEPTPPPADGYYDLVLDDSEPQSAPAAGVPEAALASPSLRGPAEAAPGARILATAGKQAAKRRFGVAALVAIAAGAVLFGAVGAMALKRPQREEERVSRALLPRAEWATSARGEGGPSPEVLAQLEADDEPASPEAPAAQTRSRDRTRRVASRPVAPSAVATRAAPDVRGQPVPVAQAARAAVPDAVAAPAVSPPAVASVSPAAEPAEDAPQFAQHGFRSPAQEVPNCVQSSVRIPRDLQGFASGPITVRFAVDKDGSVALFRVEGQVPDRRIADAIWSAVRDCRFVPGADDQGRPTRLWVVLPVRFVR